MKKLLLGIILSGLFALPVFADDTFVLRGVTLGMNRQEVARIETGVPVDEDTTPDMMAFYQLEESIFGLEDAKVFYYFTDPAVAQSLNFEEDRLYALGIMFKPYTLQNEQAVTDYRHIIVQMRDAYGEPVFWGLMEDGVLDYTCNDEKFSSMTQSFDGALTGRAFWYAADFYICVDLYNNDAANERMIYLTGALAPMGATWNELTLKE